MWTWIPALRHYFFKGEDRLKEEKPEGLFSMMVSQLASAPLTQLEGFWQERCQQTLMDPAASEREFYDLLVEIHKSSACVKSSFVETLTNVEKYYPRPE